ncbi:NADPH:quinone oxidoreductase family protein [Sandaracinobacteroides hominis]|uniref:NADPH:quinone oxidoreductase family protein n=1 Tax=Sandaracinobacteroides hominis TaxID=2780086 RepID=UPI0018F4686B|nr:NADPH:quinone oxidoreductase family protein [Sandaracinobacteroides hominis]
MRAWRVEKLEGISALELQELPDPPAPGAGEATVAMSAVGLNYPDLLMLSGGYQFRPELPYTPGMEGVGRITAVGEGVAADLLGLRMLVGGRTGLLAEQLTLPLASLRPVPEALGDAEAAGFTTGALTAWVALQVRGRLAQGEHLLVLGAGGGMGLAAVSMGVALGARVTAVASTGAKREAALAAGASQVVEMDREAPDFTALKAQCDVVFDPVGGAAVVPALKTLRWGGRYLVIGFVGGRPDPLPTNLALLKGLEILGVRAGEAGRQDPAIGRAALAGIDRLAAEGKLRPQVGLEVPFESAAEAFRRMEDGTLLGKAVIRVRG